MFINCLLLFSCFATLDTIKNSDRISIFPARMNQLVSCVGGDSSFTTDTITEGRKKLNSVILRLRWMRHIHDIDTIPTNDLVLMKDTFNAVVKQLKELEK